MVPNFVNLIKINSQPPSKLNELHILETWKTNQIKDHRKKQLHKTNDEEKILWTVTTKDTLGMEDKDDRFSTRKNSTKKRVDQNV